MERLLEGPRWPTSPALREEGSRSMRDDRVSNAVEGYTLFIFKATLVLKVCQINVIYQ